MKAHLLIIDDDANTLASLARAFRLAGHEATVCDNPARALEMAKAGNFDLIFSDVVMPGMDGLTLLEHIKAAGVTTPVVMMSGQAHIEMAVKATRLGAADFLEKPLSTDKLLLTVQNTLKLERLQQENQQLRQRLGGTEIIFAGEKMKRLLAQVARVAASESRVCILGETGTGKELIARTVHEKSQRKDGPYVTLNCAAVPAELIESELFGHEKGSFTGAANRHIGKFEQAHEGTLFLDEIGDMPLAMQAKLLRVLEQGEVERIGGDKPVKVNVRVVVATHRNLEEHVRQGAFRQDLFHRVYVFPVSLPPLRERVEDIPVLVTHFAALITQQNGWREVRFTPEALAALEVCAWPGNIRELRNVVERLLLFAEDETVTAATVRAALPSQATTGAAVVGPLIGTLAEKMEKLERQVIVEEIARQNNHITNTAKALGLERSHLYKKCQQLGIDLRELRK
ncbi:MAG TPA: sigma-54 dependent transcriptional regulator [Candidatus Saccharimonadales bacterium]|jgi:two-component system nitrogen regulation response regulator NtrX|nr:sigma-54 dependent transcriptional regulator [Candidatus Saccharimonadales bacterium]